MTHGPNVLFLTCREFGPCGDVDLDLFRNGCLKYPSPVCGKVRVKYAYLSWALSFRSSIRDDIMVMLMEARILRTRRGRLCMATETPLSEATVDETGSCHSSDHSHSYAADKAKLQARLRRIEGQVRGVGRMVDEDKYCIDILTQISAAISSMQSVGLLLLEDHIRGCVVDAGPDDREHRLKELNQAIERFTRSVG